MSGAAEHSRWQVWNISNLRSLSLVGRAWHHLSNTPHMSRLLKQSPNLEVSCTYTSHPITSLILHRQYLELPVELSTLPFQISPHLTDLKLSLHSGGVFSANISRALFLDAHPSIRTLTWYPLGPVSLSPSALPSLRALNCGREVLEALEATDVVRSVECIDVWSLDAGTVTALENVDPAQVRKIKLYTLSSLEPVKTLAVRFPGVTWLSMPCVYYSWGREGAEKKVVTLVRPAPFFLLPKCFVCR